ncbi:MULTISPECIES: hypothetical protein [Halomonas]|uniref:Anti-sigma-K factor RskA n=1 Tax=Halomonas stenophila TaxID=795312 RepID=A0A7W5EW93_9GAMM|nr:MULTISPECIES: hypothetical protein [Halomonas]MBB3231826.1 anti-sigma-K factor RskA [Halomonas stenophila]UYG07417.1 hypothetical protein OCT48_17555 [Halomonas sp. M4R1S46]
MTLIRSGQRVPRRGATRRRRKRRFDWSVFDRWLDRLVTLAVVTALVVGGAALLISLVL